MQYVSMHWYLVTDYIYQHFEYHFYLRSAYIKLFWNNVMNFNIKNIYLMGTVRLWMKWNQDHVLRRYINGLTIKHGLKDWLIMSPKQKASFYRIALMFLLLQVMKGSIFPLLAIDFPTAWLERLCSEVVNIIVGLIAENSTQLNNGE